MSPNRRLHILFFLILLAFEQNAIAQTDSTYIGTFSQEYSGRVFIARKYTSLSHETGNDKTDEYMPNNPFDIGIGFSWGGSSFSFSHGFNFLADPEKGKTRSLDLQYHYYGKKIVLDFFGQDYKGFYLEDTNKENIIGMYPDMQLTKVGLFGQYVFNGNKFSYRSAFDQTERQLKSAGSLLLGGGIYYTRVRAETSLAFYKDLYQVGPSIGYAYTWVINRHFFLTGSVTPGLTVGFKNINDTLIWNPSVFFRSAFGYNADSWSLNASFLLNKLYVSYKDDNHISLNSGNFQFTFIKRFDSNSRILKKIPRF